MEPGAARLWTRVRRRSFRTINRIACSAHWRMTRVRSFRSSLQLQLCMRARSCTAWLSALLTSSNLLRLPASIRADLPRTLTSADWFQPCFRDPFPVQRVACNVDASKTIHSPGQLGADAGLPCAGGSCAGARAYAANLNSAASSGSSFANAADADTACAAPSTTISFNHSGAGRRAGCSSHCAGSHRHRDPASDAIARAASSGVAAAGNQSFACT
jgi:hypothetical protein